MFYQSYLLAAFLLIILAIGCSDPTKQALQLSSGGTAELLLQVSDTPTAYTLDCTKNEKPDEVGVVFSLSSPTLKLYTPKKMSDYLRFVVSPSDNFDRFSFLGEQNSASCVVTYQPVQGNCSSSVIFKSANADHAHVAIATDPSTKWDPFPVSGNHWGAWAAWNKDYPEQILKGFLVHNLEHGGIVLSYKCSSAAESDECRQAHDNLVKLSALFGETRFLITPAPAQPALYALRAWRYGYLSDCYNESDMLAFMNQRYRKGREDEDSDPKISFDPASNDVPCEDLLSAPDSCS